MSVHKSNAHPQIVRDGRLRSVSVKEISRLQSVWMCSGERRDTFSNKLPRMYPRTDPVWWLLHCRTEIDKRNRVMYSSKV